MKVSKVDGSTSEESWTCEVARDYVEMMECVDKEDKVAEEKMECGYNENVLNE